MATPANFDIHYYRGDTYTFYIVPTDTDGNELDLSSFTALFSIASARGPDPAFDVAASASIDGSRILCTISPTVGLQLVDAQYVYDVQVSSGPSEVHTYLTGNVYVTLDVTEA